MLLRMRKFAHQKAHVGCCPKAYPVQCQSLNMAEDREGCDKAAVMQLVTLLRVL